MRYGKVSKSFLLSIIGILGLISFLASCATSSSERTPTSTPQENRNLIQRVTENLPINQPAPKNELVYRGPIEHTISAGSFLPGTPIKYVGLTADKTAEVQINGQRAFKRVSDSLDWTGTPVANINVHLNDRVLWFGEQQLQLVGTIRLTVNGVAPKRDAIPPLPKQPTPSLLVYKVPVVYRVKRGEAIPGTTLTYVGKTENGAELGGLPKDEYAYRQVGDSIAWQGQLRSRVYLDLLLRTTVYDDQTLNLTGLATLILPKS